MKSSIFILIIILFSLSSNSQVFIGGNFNHFENNKTIIRENIEPDFLPIEVVYGFKAKKIPYNIKVSFYSWKYEIPLNATYKNIYLNTIPLTISKRIYFSDSISSLYFNPGIRYSLTYGIDNFDKQYLIHGTGIDLSVICEFNSNMISVGITENIEFAENIIQKRSVYFSWQILLSKNLLKFRKTPPKMLSFF